MQNKSNLSLIILAMAACNAFASGDEAVDCKTVKIGEQTVYSGVASCRTLSGVVLSSYFNNSLNQNVFLHSIQSTESCIARLHFSTVKDVYGQKCKYTPKAYTRLWPLEESADAVIEAHASDRDGSISNISMWIDGVKQSSTGVTLRGREGDSFSIRVEATDNDGYTTTHNTSVTLKYLPTIPN